MNTYKITHRAKCPNNGLFDSYEIEIRSASTIEVEKINKTMNDAPETIFQEDLADYVVDKVGGSVRIEGWHQGVLVVSERSNVKRICR